LRLADVFQRAHTREGDARPQAPMTRARAAEPGEMQVETPKWMKDRPEYKQVIN
jgi:hypothetical protein